MPNVHLVSATPNINTWDTEVYGSYWVTNGTTTCIVLAASNSTQNASIVVNNVNYYFENIGQQETPFENQSAIMFMAVLNGTYPNQMGLVSILPQNVSGYVSVGPITNINTVIANANNNNTNNNNNSNVNNNNITIINEGNNSTDSTDESATDDPNIWESLGSHLSTAQWVLYLAIVVIGIGFLVVLVKAVNSAFARRS